MMRGTRTPQILLLFLLNLIRMTFRNIIKVGMNGGRVDTAQKKEVEEEVVREKEEEEESCGSMGREVSCTQK